MTFQKGQSGNPGGRKKQDGDIRELARAASPRMLQHLIDIADNVDASDKTRASAANHVLDRAYGKPPQSLGDGDGNALDWVSLLAAARAR